MSFRRIDFSEFRECYRLYFSYILESAIEHGELLSRPEKTEKYLVENQLDIFAPLFSTDSPSLEKFKAYAKTKSRVFAGVNLKTLDVARRNLAACKPGMIGCHYRSIGLSKLRNSKYQATDAYWESVEREDQRFRRFVGPDRRKNEEAHLQSLLRVYFNLFDKPKTINQQIFNTDRPLGPIGLILKIEETGAVKKRTINRLKGNSSVLVLDSLFDGLRIDLIDELVAGLKDKRNGVEYLGFLRYVLEGEKGGSDFTDYCKRLADSRTELEKNIFEGADLDLLEKRGELTKTSKERILEKRVQRWEKIREFFRRRLPRNDLIESRSGILEMLQACCVYGSLTGMCIYTFPAAMKADLPTCGLTLMCRRPLDEYSLDFLQHTSEMIYGDLIGNKVLQQYRRSFLSNLHGSSRNEKSNLRLLADEDANLVLTATLADAPIPIAAVNNFLGLASSLTNVSIYEHKPFGYFLVLVHQEFLESFIDRLRDSSERKIREFFYNDDLSIQLASHGMRIEASERSAPDNVLFFVYPPFEEKIRPSVAGEQDLDELGNGEARDSRNDKYIKSHVQERYDIEAKSTAEPPDEYLDALVKKHSEAIGRREAIILSDIVPTKELLSSNRLQYIYSRHFNADLESDADGDPGLASLAEALTFGNSEILVLIYEPNREMKIYHEGAMVLETRLSRWALPARKDSDFFRELHRCCREFLREDHGGAGEAHHAGDIGDAEYTPGTSLTKGLVNFLKECSRRRKGLFLVFYPGLKREEWQPLDAIKSGRTEAFVWSLKKGFDWDKQKLWSFLRKASISDGAIVFCLQAQKGSAGVDAVEIYTKIRITTHGFEKRHGSADETVHRNISIMKALQAQTRDPELRSFGTKHSAAYEYAMAYQKGFAVVVSDDGPVTLFCPKELDETSRAELEEAGRIPKGWKWRVGIEKM